MVLIRKPAPERREQVLQAAQSAFAAVGYDAVVMDDIARACGIARPTLYEYFRSKEEILLALIDDVLARAPSAVPPGATCRDRLAAMAAAQLRFIQQNRLVYRLMFQKIPALSGPVAEPILARRRQQGAAVVSAVEEGLRSGELKPGAAVSDVVFLVQALVAELGSILLMTDQDLDVEGEVRRLLALLFAGVAANPKEGTTA